MAVVGGGVAGSSAAVGCAKAGASVTLFESSLELLPAKSRWPGLIDGERAESEPEHASLLSAGVELRLGVEVVGVSDTGNLTTLKGSAAGFDCVVVATGSKPLPGGPEGMVKKGANLLDGPESYRLLRESVDGYSLAGVEGDGLLVLQVAERLQKRGLRVVLFSPGGAGSPQFEGVVLRRIERSIVESGVTLSRESPRSLAGVGAVEAVLAGSDVVPCDSFVYLPARTPRVPGLRAKHGATGGVLVDERMRSSLTRVFAAGSCAEMASGRATFPLSLESTARATGTVAGVNAAGRNASTRVVGALSTVVFGLDVASSGLTLAQSLSSGFDAVVASSESGFGCASIVYSRTALRVLGIQVAGEGASALATALPAVVSNDMRLDQLAYAEWPSSIDISPLSEAAREALA